MRHKGMYIVLLVAAMIGMSSPVSATSYYEWYVEVSPPNPTPHDNVQVIAGVGNTGRYTYQLASSARQGSHIRIDVTAIEPEQGTRGIGMTMIRPFNIPVHAGKLAAGSYMVSIFINNQLEIEDGFEVLFTPQHQISLEYNVDRQGGDYRNFPLSTHQPGICQSECLRDPQCKAFTYVRPRGPNDIAQCWLKNEVPRAMKNICCNSGVKSSAESYRMVEPGELPHSFSTGEILFSEGFERGLQGWRADPGWNIRQEGGNAVLIGQGHTGVTLNQGEQWSNFSFRFRLNLLHGGIHANYRIGREGRYFFGIRQNIVYLMKTQPWGTITKLADVNQSVALGVWHDVMIEGKDGRLKLSIDDMPVIDYHDPRPVMQGSIGFEMLDDSAAYVDDVKVFAIY